MKRIICFLMVFMCFVSLAWANDPVVEKLSKTPLPDLVEPHIDIKTLPNGMLVYYLQDAQVPVVNLKVFLKKIGTLYEQKSERGITDLFLSALRIGGTATLLPEVFDEKLSYSAIKITPKSGAELSSVHLMCLQKDANQAFSLFFDLLKNPGFNAERLEVIKKNKINKIKKRNEKTMDIALREFLQDLYGQDSPHAWLYNEETIKRVTQQTLKDFYAKTVAPNQMIVAVAAPYSFDEFLKIFEPYVMSWHTKVSDPKRPKPIEKKWEPGVMLVQKEGVQSAIAAGHFGDKRFNPDKFNIIMADEILGGSTMGARFGKRIRTELGLAYSVNSGFGLEDDYGKFYVATTTNMVNTVKVVTEIKNVLDQFVNKQDISIEELDAAKNRILNRLVFAYENPFEVVSQRVLYDYYGYPPGYVSVYQKQIQAVTLEGVKSILKQYFFPDKLKVVIVGDAQKIVGIEKLKGLKEIELDFE